MERLPTEIEPTTWNRGGGGGGGGRKKTRLARMMQRMCKRFGGVEPVSSVKRARGKCSVVYPFRDESRIHNALITIRACTPLN